MISRTAEPEPAEARILMVCVGNVCRSPLASLLLARLLPDTQVVIDSAGIGALVGAPMPDEAQDIARGWGIESSEQHVARQFVPEDAVGAALVLTATRSLRRAVVESAPSAVRRTFTLREFARIISEQDDPVGAARLNDSKPTLPGYVRAAAARRGTVQTQASIDDVVDPYRRGIDFYESSAHQIADACKVIASALIHVVN